MDEHGDCVDAKYLCRAGPITVMNPERACESDSWDELDAYDYCKKNKLLNSDKFFIDADENCVSAKEFCYNPPFFVDYYP